MCSQQALPNPSLEAELMNYNVVDAHLTSAPGTIHFIRVLQLLDVYEKASVSVK